VSEDYNGWANWETWVTGVWIDNEQTRYWQACALVDERRGGDIADVSLASALELWVKDWPEITRVVDDRADLASDLLSGALGRVDWLAMARSRLED
jgi:hypothetical protein